MAQRATEEVDNSASAGAHARVVPRWRRYGFWCWMITVAAPCFAVATASASHAASVKATPVERSISALPCAVATCDGVRRRPVCANDGRTYSSTCEVQRLNRCDGKALLVVDCASLTMASTMPPPPPAAHPQPLAALQSRADDRCTSSLKREFAAGFLRHIRDEFDRHATGTHTLTGLARSEKIVNWKFDNLDLDKNDRLSAAELRQLKRLVKSNLQPRACSRDIAETCDGDSDGDISREEWAACLRLRSPTSSAAYEDMQADMHLPAGSSRATAPDGMGDVEEPQLHAVALPVVNRRTASQLLGNGLPAGDLYVSHQQRRHGHDMEGKRVRSNSDHLVSIAVRTCADARESARRNQNQGTLQKPIPVCQKNGKFQREQCFPQGRACWCVDEDSGSPILGSVVYDGAAKLNCTEERPAAASGNADDDDDTAAAAAAAAADAQRRPSSSPPPLFSTFSQPRERDFPGCLNKKFSLADVVSTFEPEMASSTKSSAFNHAADAGGWTAAEKALHWKVVQSDKNNDRRLNANEARELVRTLSAGANSNRNRLPSRCAADFLVYCDSDGDKHLTYDELADCLELKPQHSPSTTNMPQLDAGAYDPRPGWPKKTDLPTALEMNPFVYLLVPQRIGGVDK